MYFGSTIDRAIVADYDGNATVDIGIFRGINGLWAIRGITRAYFGDSGDEPKASDYDGNAPPISGFTALPRGCGQSEI